jgi:hypothetical protein
LVNAGDIVTCQVTSQTANSYVEMADGNFSGTGGPEDIVTQVSSILAQQGFGVLNSSVGSAAMNTLENLLTLGTGISFQATMQIQVPMAFAQPTDVLSIVENAFYQATGVYPTAATAPTDQSSGQPAQPTGLPTLSPAGVGGSSSSVSAPVVGAATGLGSVLSSLGSSTLLLLALLIGVLIFVAGYSPNTRHVAEAFA